MLIEKRAKIQKSTTQSMSYKIVYRLEFELDINKNKVIPHEFHWSNIIINVLIHITMCKKCKLINKAEL